MTALIAGAFAVGLTACTNVATDQPTTGDQRTDVAAEVAGRRDDTPATVDQQEVRQDSRQDPQEDPDNGTPARIVKEIPIPDESLMPLLSAEFALRERRFDDALPLLAEQALKLDDPELTRRALQLAEFRGQDDASLALAVRLAEQDREDAAAAATAMALLIRAGDSERAVFFAREAKRRGARINAPALLVDYQRLGPERQSTIARAIESLAADWPDDQDIGIALALVRRESGDADGSLDALEALLANDRDEERALVLWTQVKLDRNDADAFDRIEAAVNRQPEAETLRLQYARLLAANEQFDAAREQFESLRDMSPRNGDYLFSLALIELEAKNPESAQTHLETLLALQQRVDEAHYYLGRIAEDRGDIDAAVTAYQQVGPSREFMDAIRRASDMLIDSPERGRWQALFTTARQNNPGQAERLYALQAESLRNAGDINGALAIFAEALDLFPDSMPLQYGRAMTWEQAGEIPAMEDDLRAILRREPNNATTLNALGYTLTVHTNRFEEAASLIERALELSPGEPAILDSLGWVYFKLGRTRQAVDLLREAYAMFPDAEVAAHLGETLWTMGRTSEAQQVWREALERQPDNEQLTETLERLGIIFDEPATN